MVDEPCKIVIIEMRFTLPYIVDFVNDGVKLKPPPATTVSTYNFDIQLTGAGAEITTVETLYVIAVLLGVIAFAWIFS